MPANQMEIELQGQAGARQLVLRVRDAALIGKPCRLVIVYRGRSTLGGVLPLEAERFAADIVLADAETLLELGAVLDESPSYYGKMLGLGVMAKLTLDAGSGNESTQEISLATHQPLPPRRAVSPEPPHLIVAPQDDYSLFANLRALSKKAMLRVLGLALVFAVLVPVNLVVALHDGFVREADTWFYDHSGTYKSKRQKERPMVKAMFIAVPAAIGLWFLFRRQLGGYARLEAKTPGRLDRGSRWNLRELVSGDLAVELRGASLRVVAFNRERGQRLQRMKGRKRSSLDFDSGPVQAVLLHESSLPTLPARMPLDTWLNATLDFSPVFGALHPPQRLRSEDGRSCMALELCLDVRIVHPLYRDVFVVLNLEDVDFAAFR